MAIPPEIISSIKDRISLVELIGESVQLKQSGRNHLGLCPFHQEKTPSFNVKDEEGYYHCFGCGAHGSAFDFVMNTRGLTFPEAAQFLANRIGIKIPSSGDWGDREKIKKENERLNLLREVMAQSAWVYANALFKEEYGEVARNYLKKRGITGQTAKKFFLGFVPQSWDFIFPELEKRKEHSEPLASQSEEQLERLLISGGLLKRRDKAEKEEASEEESSREKRVYDTFRNRIIFTVSRSDGRPIAFGGRTFSDDKNTPKYINSPETDLYKKRRTFYGLCQAMRKMRETRHAYIVEGYFDVLSMSQAGFEDVLATCGTAVTEEHVGVLKRFVDRVSLVFDGDAAGKKAAASCFELFLGSGIDVSAIVLPTGEDPDSLCQNMSRDDVSCEFAKNKQSIAELYIDSQFLALESDRDSATAAIRGKVAQKFVQALKKTNNAVERDILIEQAAGVIGVSQESIKELFDSSPAKKSYAPASQSELPPSPPVGNSLESSVSFKRGGGDAKVAQQRKLSRQLVLTVVAKPSSSSEILQMQVSDSEALVIDTLEPQVVEFIKDVEAADFDDLRPEQSDDDPQVKGRLELLAKHGLGGMRVIEEVRRAISRGVLNVAKILAAVSDDSARWSLNEDMNSLRGAEAQSESSSDLQNLVQEKLLKKRNLERLNSSQFGRES